MTANSRRSKLRERLLSGRRLNQILAELFQDDFVTEKLRRLIVDEKDIHCDPGWDASSVPRPQRWSQMRRADSNCSVLTGFAR